MSSNATHRVDGSASDEAAVMADRAVVAAGWAEAMTIRTANMA